MTFDLPLPPTPVIETERLILRPLRAEDAPAIQRHFPHWPMVRHLLARVPWPYPQDGAATNVCESLEKRARGEQLFWAITLKGGDDELIGRIDLRPDAGDREMRGFWLAQPFWGKGFMTEAAEAVTAYAFETLGWPYLYVTNSAANLGSRGVKMRQGFRLVETEEAHFVEGLRLKEFWLLTAETWRQQRGIC